jgi:hypothetical protein
MTVMPSAHTCQLSALASSNGVDKQNMNHDTLQQLKSQLDCIFDHRSSDSQRKAAETCCTALAPTLCSVAGEAIQSPEVLSDPQLYWFFVSSYKRHVLGTYWRATDDGKRRVLQDVSTFVRTCHFSGAAHNTAKQIYSLQSTVLCWAASEAFSEAQQALLSLADIHAGAPTPHDVGCRVTFSEFVARFLRRHVPHLPMPSSLQHSRFTSRKTDRTSRRTVPRRAHKQ